MPCRDGDVPVETVDERDLREANRKLQERNDKLARMLCELCTYIETIQNRKCSEMFSVSEEVKEWWKQHKIFDENRKHNMKREALAKLTDEEKVLLGLT